MATSVENADKIINDQSLVEEVYFINFHLFSIYKDKKLFRIRVGLEKRSVKQIIQKMIKF